MRHPLRDRWATGSRVLPPAPQERREVEFGPFPAPHGAAARQPHRVDRYSGGEGDHRGRTRHRRRVPAKGIALPGECFKRSDPVRGRRGIGAASVAEWSGCAGGTGAAWRSPVTACGPRQWERTCRITWVWRWPTHARSRFRSSGSATKLNMVRYVARKDGPLSSNVAEAGAFLKSRPDLEACDLEIVFAPLGSLDGSLAPPAADAFSLSVALLTPQSRGRITIASADPPGSAARRSEYLSHPEDRARLIGGKLLGHGTSAGSEPFAAFEAR